MNAIVTSPAPFPSIEDLCSGFAGPGLGVGLWSSAGAAAIWLESVKAGYWLGVMNDDGIDMEAQFDVVDGHPANIRFSNVNVDLNDPAMQGQCLRRLVDLSRSLSQAMSPTIALNLDALHDAREFAGDRASADVLAQIAHRRGMHLKSEGRWLPKLLAE